jgi:hypothetical protein
MASAGTTVQGTYVGAPANLDPGISGCTGYYADQSERVYEITIPAGETLTAILVPSGTDDVSIYAVTDCADVTTSCVAGADAGYEGDAEGIQYTNSGATDETIFVVADGSYVSGSFELKLNVGAEVECGDLWDNDQNSAIDCNDAACQSTAACAPGSGVAGAPCTASSDCAATGSDPLCFEAFGADGYCSEWCTPSTGMGCSGDGVCVDAGLTADVGFCLDGCTASPDCLSDQYCDTTGGYCLPLPGACISPPTIALGDTSGDTSTGTDDTSSNCNTGDGQEVGYVFVAPSTGTLTITLSSVTDQGFSVRTPGCAALADEQICEDAAGGGVDEIDTIAVTQGETYFILVEAYTAGEEGPFDLNLSLP